MKELLLFPSMMCADISDLKSEIKKLLDAGVDGFHMDIMDGNYVPNIALGLNELKFLRENTKKIMDVHLMVENVADKIDFYADLGCDIIYFHPDNEKHPAKIIDNIHKRDKKAGIVINPGLSLEFVKPLLDIVDYILIMTVNPGFAGQKYLNYVDKKIIELVKIIQDKNIKIFVDGAISKEKIKNLYDIGVSGFVLGTSALFGKEKTYKELINNIRSENKYEKSYY